MTKHKFRYGEEEYTICITLDDWWLEEPVDMSEGMIRAGNEFALENGMAPDVNLCAGCNKGTYVNINRNYHIADKILEALHLRCCDKCGHTILPPWSVEKVDKILEALKA